MSSKFVMVKADVYCEWKHREPPSYRVFVNDELFAERTYTWRDQYLEELLQIWAPPGKYALRWELVANSRGTLRVDNIRIEEGPQGARIIKNSLLRIEDESI
jgi:hypothetical protein